MNKTIKVRTETIEEAREEFENKLPVGSFVLEKTEFNPWKPIFETGYCMQESVEEALEEAKSQLPDSFQIKGEIISEIKNNTHVMVSVQVKAESKWEAEYKAAEYIKNRFFPDAGFHVAEYHYKIRSNECIQKGFKGVWGVGKQEDTYKVTFYMKPEVRLKYSMWSYIIAQITDEIEIANQQFIKFSTFGSFDGEGIKRLISQGVNINYCDEAGKNALICSSVCDKIETVMFLIDKGININHCDINGRNALFYSYDKYDISKLLIDKGIDFKKIDNYGDNILTYQIRKSGYLDKHRFGNKLREFMEQNGVKEDQALIKEFRKAELHEIEDSKRWCPNCNKKVNTVEDGHYYDDGWMEEADIKCSKCGTLIEHYRGQTR